MTIALRHAAADLFVAVYRRMDALFQRRGRHVVAPGVVLARGQEGSFDLIDRATGRMDIRLYQDGSFYVAVEEPTPATTHLSRLLPPCWTLLRRGRGWVLVGDAGDCDEHISVQTGRRCLPKAF
jgi:hypothetical protein